jgi:hypothetical protein
VRDGHHRPVVIHGVLILPHSSILKLKGNDVGFPRDEDCGKVVYP